MKTTLIVILSLIALSVLSFGIWTCNKATNAADYVVDNGFTNYEQFQDIYNTCSKLNTDLGNMQSLPENDKMFDQFSKAQRVNAIKTNLNRWVEDYNAKSKMWNKALWKSKQLPYQLSVNDFSNYK
jgi:hypothetical protein